MDRRNRLVVGGALMALAGVLATATPVAAGKPAPPPIDAGADYQLGGDYPLPTGVTVVARDWFSGTAAPDPAYSICYVNAFQTQADESGVDRPDEASNWPDRLVLRSIGDDPNWPGEYVIDLSTRSRRRAAADHVAPMVQSCADKGFEAVEFDNLDSWTRFDGTGREGDIPFGRRQAVAYATLLTRHAHALGLAVGQKNTPQLGRTTSREVIGFDFVIAEECGQYRECGAYRRAFGRRIVDIEYTDRGYARACRSIGDIASVIRRDVNLRLPSHPRYVYDSC